MSSLLNQPGKFKNFPEISESFEVGAMCFVDKSKQACFEDESKQAAVVVHTENL